MTTDGRCKACARASRREPLDAHAALAIGDNYGAIIVHKERINHENMLFITDDIYIWDMGDGRSAPTTANNKGLQGVAEAGARGGRVPLARRARRRHQHAPARLTSPILRCNGRISQKQSPEVAPLAFFDSAVLFCFSRPSDCEAPDSLEFARRSVKPSLAPDLHFIV
ncbi:hypothetical protein EVAR_43200_1 [Eumeta japonica]|uniref:Uncharacterized protein n=1 Tax=Eumeta variegata TaxID=151549 RepID=A0A4C1WVT5_EUMVA|nr:hypothetical protein EVAR_43200_1 [Eumeta japonica]